MDNLPPLSEHALCLKIGMYQHYKGNMYQLLHIGRAEETLEEVVIYQSTDKQKQIWVRPLKNFIELVSISDTDSAIPRFKFVRGL